MTNGRRKGLITLVAVAAGVGVWLFLRKDSLPEAVELRPAVHNKPPVPIVFTSRSEPVSFEAPAPEGAGHQYPGQTLWAAKEGRLRLLTPEGTVHELTWGRKLADGSTLIDVMSPSISLDGKKIIFAARKGPPDPGRFRLYEVGVSGKGLRQITGKADDPGCVEVPPLRFDFDGKVMSHEDRKRLDYDDIDP